MTLWPYHSEDEISAVADVLRSGKTNYWSGSNGQAFESEFAQYTGAKHAIAVTNGTTALELALHGLDLPPGSEVIVPCRTFMATASAVVTAGCKPVLADIDATLNVTVETLEARRTEKTEAVIVVHYAGLPCDMAAIMDWAGKNTIYVIEDCAHAHGARINGQHVGTFGDVGCFSFCVGKIMSLGGEGGMVITNDETLHRRMGARRDHGRYQMVGSKDMTQFQWTVEEFGTNLRMTEMQSAIGRIATDRSWMDGSTGAIRLPLRMTPFSAASQHPLARNMAGTCTWPTSMTATARWLSCRTWAWLRGWAVALTLAARRSLLTTHMCALWLMSLVFTRCLCRCTRR
jgi:dTDP-4-amino-4,6-dideoxygalactose transaminase